MRVSEENDMGINDRENERRESKRDAKRKRVQETTATVSVEDIDAGALLACIHHVVSAGGAIRFGHTRDHGAWAIGVYGDGSKPYTEYVRGSEDINRYLANLGQFFAGEPTEGP
jgi:hypothetical protein